MGTDSKYVLTTVRDGQVVYLKAGDLTYVKARKAATGFHTSKAAKHQVKRLKGTSLESVVWTIESPI